MSINPNSRSYGALLHLSHLSRVFRLVCKGWDEDADILWRYDEKFEIVLIFNAEIIVSANFDHGGSPDVSGVETNDRVVDFTLLLQHV